MDEIEVKTDDGALVAMSFGDAEGVLDRRDWLSYAECNHNGRWYYPPVSRDGLAKSFDVAPHHASCIRLKEIGRAHV